eukprot:TRINITY_DN4690_c0_g3_i1.p1 TRINITY_DN4690_c0_g3~~TRINITY_DN4690_c0_g3_i1.p1  ORF type:complete len:354 (+),score=66.02 TRINITY_DN4690_c0_g3_i1:103-1164(+)
MKQELNHLKNRLKKTETVDRSNPQIDNDRISQINTAALEYRNKIIQVNVDQWIDYIQEYTFPTLSVDLNQDISRCIQEGYIHFQETGDIIDYDTFDVLGLFEESLDQMIRKFPNGAFIRMSTRSPKYSVIAKGKSRSFLIQELEKISQKESLLEDKRYEYNAKLLALYRSGLKGLRVFSGREALELILSSFRIYEDLLREDESEHSKISEFKMFVREWIEFPMEMEFRAFVYNGQLNAISQCYDEWWFEGLDRVFDGACLKVRTFFEEEIREKLPIDSYIIDFAIIEEQVKVIELNPFQLYASGPGLFNWEDENDVKIMTEGPYTTKIRVEPPEVSAGILTDVNSTIDNILNL